ncbi:citron Rho-interacting kinase-like [Littorina saxatilis]|uniref:Uncharacterized protein n=1 Tax=Littorina saxatilis TaxID=31220 RepID=A0AAN9GIT2_9CAEN
MSVGDPARSRKTSKMENEPGIDVRVTDDEDDDTPTGDKLHLRLLLMEDKQRSQLMWRQVAAFQDKVTVSFNTFSPETLLFHVRALSSLPNQNRILANSIHSLARLRMVVQQQLRRANLRSDGSVYFAGLQESSVVARCTQFFGWFFEFMDYLNELHSNFVERIFLPLFKFFHEISFLGSRSRASTSASTFSKMSLFSVDSGGGEMEENHDNVFKEREAEERAEEDVTVSVDTARRRAQSRTALQLLGNEYKDIKGLYDTTDMDKVAHRLSFLKDQLDFMLEEEDEIDPDLFSPESQQLLYPLDMDEGTENLVRLPLDLLVKFRKAIWLARRWLELYDKRTYDLNTKLQKVLTLENTLTQRLQSLDGNILQHEHQLERNTDDLHRLMKREERTDGLTFALYDIEAKAESLEGQLKQLRRLRDAITSRVKLVAQTGRVQEYRRLKMDFEKNKLQRYLLERLLATLNYQRQLSEQDRKVELEMRPSLIRHTNHVQDTCERLEQTIREQKRERDNIRCALIPIQEDRQTLSDKVSRMSANNVANSADSHRRLRSGEARFVRTINVNNRVNRLLPNQVNGCLAVPRPPLKAPGWISPPQW